MIFQLEPPPDVPSHQAGADLLRVRSDSALASELRLKLQALAVLVSVASYDVWRKKVANGDVFVVRYADDLVVGVQHRTDAQRFL